MPEYTFYGSRSDAGGIAMTAFLLAIGFWWVGVVDHFDPRYWPVGVLVVLAPALAGVWGLAATIWPARLELTKAGFQIRRVLWPTRTVRWDDVEAVGMSHGYRTNSPAYRLTNGRQRGFFMMGGNPHELIELMNTYLQPRPGMEPPARAEHPFGHRAA
jgi:hypothetical protein